MWPLEVSEFKSEISVVMIADDSFNSLGNEIAVIIHNAN